MKDLLQHIVEKEKKVVLFDVFDTILLRNVEPEYTKKIWAKRLSIQIGDSIPYDELYLIRNQLEGQLCQLSLDNGDDQEFHFGDFIDVLFRKLKDQNMISSRYDYSSFERECKEIELEVEKAVQFVDSDWINTVCELRKMNIRVVCVSDFYLSKDMLEQLFEYHNILSFIDDIYVSSNYKKTKRSGRLFEIVLSELNVDSSDVIMVGDNKHSDYEIPKGLGLCAYLIDRENQMKIYQSFKQIYENGSTYINGIRLIAEKMKNDKSNILKEVTFSLFMYTSLLHKQLIKNKTKDVFFLAREGEFLLKLFSEYQKREGMNTFQYISPHYLKVSRKSTFLPSLKNLNEEKFDILFRQYRNISINDFLSSINFSEETIFEITNRLIIDKDNKENDLPTSEAFEKLINDLEFRTVYEKNRVNQKKLFLQYLNQYGTNVEEEGLHLVDVGWKGTIQDNIYRLLDNEINVNGYYLGLISSGDKQDNNRKHGVLFSALPYKSQFFDVYNENRALYEIILGASHGSANHYVEENERVIVETVQTQKEKELFIGVINPLQDSIFQYFIELCDLFCKKNIKIEKYMTDFAKIHARMVLFPTNKEINFFNGLYHYENFGVFEYSTFSVNNSNKFIDTIKNSLVMVKDPRRILNKGFWAPITLKNEGLGYLIKIYGWYKYRKSFLNKNMDYNHDKYSEKYKIKYKEQKEVIDKMNNMIIDRDAAIKDMTKMIDDRDAAIKSMTKMIDDRDEVIRQLSLKIQSKQNTVD